MDNGGNTEDVEDVEGDEFVAEVWVDDRPEAEVGYGTVSKINGYYMYIITHSLSLSLTLSHWQNEGLSVR